MTKVLVSFCLFGDDADDIYYRGAIRNAEMYAELRPEWGLIFYVGASVPAEVVGKICAANPCVSIIRMLPDRAEDQSATLWRFAALRKDEYDAFIFRDVDSRPGDRELGAVDEWLASGKYFHVMRDHIRHGVPMLAGLWGVKASQRESVLLKLSRPPSGSHYQIDQDWLRARVWPMAQRSVMAHVDCQWDFGTETAPFPYPRTNEMYLVAECHRGDDTLRFPEHRAEIPGYRKLRNEHETLGKRV